MSSIAPPSSSTVFGAPTGRASSMAAGSGPSPLVVADIGGTNARFGWAAHPGADVEHVRTLPTADFAGPGPAMRRYLADLPSTCHEAVGRAGLQAAWALAAVVGEDAVSMTNNGWRFSCRQERQSLSLSALHLYNDFEALAYSLPYLGSAQWRSWDGRPPGVDGPLAVIGPGTGLGVAGLVRAGSAWKALSGEGGHMTLSAADDFEDEVLRLARRHWPHVSAERLLSGIGLPLLHDCISRVEGRGEAVCTTESIFAQGLAGEPGARRTLEVFSAMLGSFAGNVALTLGAVGGVFIGGGLVPRLGELFFTSAFRERFEAKGRFSGYLADIPTVLITDTLVALRGASAAVVHAPSGNRTPELRAGSAAGG